MLKTLFTRLKSLDRFIDWSIPLSCPIKYFVWQYYLNLVKAAENSQKRLKKYPDLRDKTIHYLQFK